MDLALRRRTYDLRRRFVISQSAVDTADVLEVTVAAGEDRGRGESAPSRRVTGSGPGDAAEAIEAWWRTRGGKGAPPARAPFAGLDAALLDLEGRRRDEPLHRLLGLDAASLATSMTVSLGTPKAMVEEARGHVGEGFTHLKVKVGEDPDADVGRVRALRDALPDAVLRVDANGGWTPKQAAAVLPRLADLDVELVEQPVASGAEAALAGALDGAPVPLFADESLVAPADLEAVRDLYDGVVVKVDKHGGPRPTRDLLEAARAAGLATMVGCNVQSSLGIAAGAHLLALADRADLDGALLLADDGYTGLDIRDGVVSTPEGPGLGVEEAIG